MKTVPIHYGLLFLPRASHPFTYEQRPTWTQSRSAAESFPNILQGLRLPRAGLTCFTVSWLQSCTRSHADLRGWASWREQSRCVTAQSQLVFPVWASAAITSQPPRLGGQQGLGCRHPTGRMEALELVCELAETENLSSALGQLCNKDKPCITGVLLLWKLEAFHKQRNY